MKKIVGLLLVLITIVGMIGYSPVNAKKPEEDIKEELAKAEQDKKEELAKYRSKDYEYSGKGENCLYDFDYNTDDKYAIVIKNADKYLGLTWEKNEGLTWNAEYPYIYYRYKSTDTTLKVQLQLINVKTGKPVKAGKVKWYDGCEDYDRTDRYYNIGKDFYGRETKSKLDSPRYQYITPEGKYSFRNGVDSIYAVYGKKIYMVYLEYDWETVREQEEIRKKQEQMDNEPFKYAPHAETTDHWYLVPKGYTWEGYSYINHYLVRDRVTGEKVEQSDIFNAVFIYSGQKIEWVIKNFDTGEEISVNKSQKKVWKDETFIDAYCGEKINAALGVKKNGKTLTYKELGNANYLASNLSVYYDGMIYDTIVVMLPTKADADWCIAHADNLSDSIFGEALDLYDYCKYKGLPTKPWEFLH